MPKSLTFDVEGVVTGIRIEVRGPRLIIEGVQQATDGRTVASFSEDVTDQLTPTQRAALTTIVTRAQAWIDAK